MKKLIMFLLPVFALAFFTSCGDENDSLVEVDDVLIEEIANAENKVTIEPGDLPNVSRNFVNQAYFDTYAEVISKVDGKGYELILASEELQYFTIDGRPLLATKRGRGFRPHHGPGGCNPSLISPDELPETITTYIAENYPDAEIIGGKERGDVIIVKISGHILLVFDTDGNFIKEAEMMHHPHGTPLEISELSTSITNYIAENYADAEIKKAFEVREGRIVVGLLLNGERVLVIFDADGNFLMER